MVDWNVWFMDHGRRLLIFIMVCCVKIKAWHLQHKYMKPCVLLLLSEMRQMQFITQITPSNLSIVEKGNYCRHLCKNSVKIIPQYKKNLYSITMPSTTSHSTKLVNITINYVDYIHRNHVKYANENLHFKLFCKIEKFTELKFHACFQMSPFNHRTGVQSIF